MLGSFLPLQDWQHLGGFLIGAVLNRSLINNLRGFRTFCENNAGAANPQTTAARAQVCVLHYRITGSGGFQSFCNKT